MSYITHLRCLDCGATHEPHPFRYTCRVCDGYLDVEYDYGRMSALRREAFERRRGSILEQWWELLPVDRPELLARVSLGEAPTPMIPARRTDGLPAAGAVWLKNDGLLPTCSLKDRSMPLTIVKALEYGRETVGIVSSGNAAASLAAYAARAGLAAVVFLRAGASQAKLFKTMAYHPIAVQVEGNYSAAEQLFEQAREEFNILACDGLVNPYRIEGKKTFAYEVARDLGWQAPKAVFMPAGYGNGIVAAWKGFQELQRFGFIDALPAMVAVQPAVCAPIARAFALGLPQVEPVPEVMSLAEAVVAGDPAVGGQRVLDAVRASGGQAMAVSEDDIAAAVRLLAEREGIACEPTGAIAFAGLLKLGREDAPYAGGAQVVSLTGHALNSPPLAGLPTPIRVPADYAAVRSAIAPLLTRWGSASKG